LRLILASTHGNQLIPSDDQYEVTDAKLVGLFIGLLFIHGCLNSIPTKYLAGITQSFVFINLGATFAIIIALLACTDTKNSASYTFGEVYNQTGWSNNGISFLFGLLSVQWVMTDCKL
jgi:amino acid transporter